MLLHGYQSQFSVSVEVIIYTFCLFWSRFAWDLDDLIADKAVSQVHLYQNCYFPVTSAFHRNLRLASQYLQTHCLEFLRNRLRLIHQLGENQIFTASSCLPWMNTASCFCCFCSVGCWFQHWFMNFHHIGFMCIQLHEYIITLFSFGQVKISLDFELAF